MNGCREKQEFSEWRRLHEEQEPNPKPPKISRKKVIQGSLTLDPLNYPQQNHETQVLNWRHVVVEEEEEEDARKMGESERRNQQQQQQPLQQQPPQRRRTTATNTASRMAMMRGEIVEVQGGHIVRSTGRKDRHSKVCTAKGPRDRRVRLSAHTAIQFYDVQDRLGYDRPSKAVDWLINKAKASIDQLAQLPAWDPNAIPMNNDSQQVAPSSEARVLDQLTTENNNNPAGSGFLPVTMDTVDIADTIKSFFPTATVTDSSSIQFQNYPPDLLSRSSSSSQSQDLRLSLQSLHDSTLLHHHQQQQHQHQQNENLFSATGTPLGLDAAASYENQPGRLQQRMAAWNAGAADTGNDDGGGGGEGGGGFLFNSPSPLFGHSHYLYSQRGTLQSSITPSIRAWMEPSLAGSAIDHHHHYLPPTFHNQSPFCGGGAGFASGFRIPARIQGEEEEHDGVSDKPSSASSDSRH